jgi:uncharacterized protein (TIGR00162 family)
MTWKIEQHAKKPQLNNAIFIEGLPGIGNVGKVVVDFIIDELNATKLCDFFSYSLPHSVFVNEKNLVELPKIELFYKKMKGKNDLLLLAGDIQPADEVSTYEFCDAVLDFLKNYSVKEIITLGGIGLPEIPKKPKVYCTGNSAEIIKRYNSKLLSNNLYGVVGPFVGVTGLFLGLAAKRKIDAITLLAETYGHPLYLGVKGAREVLKVLDSRLKWGINLDKLEDEIEDIENEIIKRTKELGDVTKQTAIKKLKGKLGGDISYIG